jgi:hypothetical protein
MWPGQAGKQEACKRKTTTTGRKTGNERANKMIRKSRSQQSEENDSTKNSHHIPKLLTLAHMSAHPCHIWVHRDNLIDYGRILQHRRHLLEELGLVHYRLNLKCAIGQYNIIAHLKTGVDFNAPCSGHSDSTPFH